MSARSKCLLLLLGSLSAGIAESACARFEPATTRLDGRLILRDDAGPPNYDRAIASNGREAVHGVGEVQLAVMPMSGIDAHRHRGRRVAVEGSLFSAHTGHHRTPVLLMVRSLFASPAQRADRAPTKNPKP